MANQFAKEGHTVEEVAAATIAAGTFAISNGVAKFYSTNGQDSAPTQAGSKVSPYVDGVQVWIDKENATDVFAQFDDVFGDVSAQTALTAAGDGKIGRAAEASANGDTRVLVEWNK